MTDREVSDRRREQELWSRKLASRVEVPVRELIRDVEAIARDTFPRTIRVESWTADDLWTVTGNPTELHQVLLNLCTNARDAMPQGGRISITARNVGERDPTMRMEAQPRRYVMIQVTDEGPGIPQTIMGRIFEPFFTTKAIGKGTGLGLATSLSIVEGHGGFIRVSNPEQGGAQFQVYLPAV